MGWGVIENVYWHFWRLQSQFANPCEVRVLKPYVPSKAEREDPRLYADNVRLLMARELGAKLSPYGIPEQQMLKRAGYCVDKTGRCDPACICPSRARNATLALDGAWPVSSAYVRIV